MTPKPSRISSTESPAGSASAAAPTASRVGPVRSPAQGIADLARDEAGQSSAEWVILTAFIIIGLVVVFGTFPFVVASYYRGISEVLTMPLP